MPTTPAHIRATTKFESKAYEKILIRIKTEANKKRIKGELTREEIQAAADRAGKSLNGYILEAIKEKIERENKEPAN